MTRNGAFRGYARQFEGKFRMLLQQLANTVGRAHGFLDLAVEFRKRAHGGGNKRGVQDEAGHLAYADTSALQQCCPRPLNQNNAAKQSEDNESDERTAQFGSM